ncbi:MAG: response regulator transcription factor [Solirubrobacteraceae bacterium]
MDPRERARRSAHLGEQAVVKLIAEGHTSHEIADLLVIRRKTVERHRANIPEKLAMRDRVDLARYAIRRALESRGLLAGLSSQL